MTSLRLSEVSVNSTSIVGSQKHFAALNASGTLVCVLIRIGTKALVMAFHLAKFVIHATIAIPKILRLCRLRIKETVISSTTQLLEVFRMLKKRAQQCLKQLNSLANSNDVC